LPFREPGVSLRDILQAISEIEAFTRDMDLTAFSADPKTVAAVERKLLVISEAAVRLGAQATALCPNQPWHEIRGVGNWLRHQYDRIDIETVWRTIEKDLPSLKAAVAKAL
jgi:uncharacterized protein with HEPN domain